MIIDFRMVGSIVDYLQNLMVWIMRGVVMMLLMIRKVVVVVVGGSMLEVIGMKIIFVLNLVNFLIVLVVNRMIVRKVSKVGGNVLNILNILMYQSGIGWSKFLGQGCFDWC